MLVIDGVIVAVGNLLGAGVRDSVSVQAGIEVTEGVSVLVGAEVAEGVAFGVEGVQPIISKTLTTKKITTCFTAGNFPA